MSESSWSSSDEEPTSSGKLRKPVRGVHVRKPFREGCIVNVFEVNGVGGTKYLSWKDVGGALEAPWGKKGQLVALLRGEVSVEVSSVDSHGASRWSRNVVRVIPLTALPRIAAFLEWSPADLAAAYAQFGGVPDENEGERDHQHPVPIRKRATPPSPPPSLLHDDDDDDKEKSTTTTKVPRIELTIHAKIVVQRDDEEWKNDADDYIRSKKFRDVVHHAIVDQWTNV